MATSWGHRASALTAALLIPLATCAFPTEALALQTTVLAQGTQSGTCSQVVPKVKDDTQNPPAWIDPASVSFNLGDAAKQNLPEALGPIPAGEAYMIGASQVSGVPWLGVNTMHPSIINNTQGDVTWELTGFSGPGAMFVFTQGGLGKVIGEEWFTGEGNSASGSTVVNRNSHVHPNWVFSAAGTYQITLTQHVQLLDGTSASGSATLTFEVGTGAGTAVDGHYDFGPTLSGDGESCGGDGEEGASTNAGTTGGTTGGTASTNTDSGTQSKASSTQQGAASNASGGAKQASPTGGTANSGGAKTGTTGASQATSTQAAKQLPNTGPTVMTFPIAFLGLGVLACGAGLVFAARHFRWF